MFDEPKPAHVRKSALRCSCGAIEGGGNPRRERFDVLLAFIALYGPPMACGDLCWGRGVFNCPVRL